MSTIHMTPEFLRGIIKGEVNFRKCPDCYGEGDAYAYNDGQIPCTMQEWSEIEAEGEEWRKAHPGESLPDRYYGGPEGCETCEGVGYIQVP